MARPHILPDRVHHLQSPHGGSWPSFDRGGPCILWVGGRGAPIFSLLGLPICILHPPGLCLLSPTHIHTGVHRPLLAQPGSWVLRTRTGKLCGVCVPRASAQTPAWRCQGLCPPAPSGSQLCSCCRLLGHSRPGAIPEYARLLLPQGARLHHGMRPFGRWAGPWAIWPEGEGQGAQQY